MQINNSHGAASVALLHRLRDGGGRGGGLSGPETAHGVLEPAPPAAVHNEMPPYGGNGGRRQRAMPENERAEPDAPPTEGEGGDKIPAFYPIDPDDKDGCLVTAGTDPRLEHPLIALIRARAAYDSSACLAAQLGLTLDEES